MMFSWTSSIAVIPSRERRSAVLARSSGGSWTEQAYADLSPSQEFAPTGEQAERALAGHGAGFVLAVALEGTFGSAFAGQKVIVQTDAGVEFVEPEAMLTESAPAKMVVFGNSLMFTDALAGQFPGNAGLLRDAVDWLAESPVGAQETERGGAPSGTPAAVVIAACVAAVCLLLLVLAARRRNT